ncbi:MAG: hypothetical protein JXL81_11645 [Deltaproteobacteria bacterium]|nr:hypothetical protein [Deltaproteobacteria bacterium]
MLKKFILILLCCLFIQNYIILAENNIPNDKYLPYTWDCSYYFKTNGAPTSGGAEAWMTLTGDQDTIYAAKGTKEQFVKMKFAVEDALKKNQQLPVIQRLKIDEKFIMVEYTKHKIQSLVGYINDNVFESIMLLPEKKHLAKLEGSIEDLKKLKFDISKTGKTDDKNKIQLLQNLQSNVWGIIDIDKSGKVNILMHNKAQNNFSTISLEKFIGYE